MQVWVPAYVEVRALTNAAGDIDETVDEPERVDQLCVRHAVVVVIDMSGERRTWSRLAVPVSVVGLCPHYASVAGLQIGSPAISVRRRPDVPERRLDDRSICARLLFGGDGPAQPGRQIWRSAQSPTPALSGPESTSFSRGSE